jgi:predicted  nucleic acid-binding Zn-ribbon protein
MSKDGVDDFMNALPKSGNKRSTSDLHAHTDTQKYNAPGGAGNADYNEKFRQKRTGLSAKDRKDKELELERENNTLKNKKNLLEQEVVKMETKLKRIDELLRSRSLAAGDNTGYDAQDLQRDLQREYDKLKDQNEFTREKVRKLAVIQRGLQSKVVVPNKVDKYAHVQGKLGFASKPQAGNNQYTTLAEDLRRQLVVNEKEIAQLQTQLNKLNLQHHGAEGGMRGADQLRRDIESMYEDIRMTNQEIEKL